MNFALDFSIRDRAVLPPARGRERRGNKEGMGGERGNGWREREGGGRKREREREREGEIERESKKERRME
jgi:hypothetical protein